MSSTTFSVRVETAVKKRLEKLAKSTPALTDGTSVGLDPPRQRMFARLLPRVPGLGSTQHDIDADCIERKDDQAVFGLLQNPSV
jgi:hypothetical protein